MPLHLLVSVLLWCCRLNPLPKLQSSLWAGVSSWLEARPLSTELYSVFCHLVLLLEWRVPSYPPLPLLRQEHPKVTVVSGSIRILTQNFYRFLLLLLSFSGLCSYLTNKMRHTESICFRWKCVLSISSLYKCPFGLLEPSNGHLVSPLPGHSLRLYPVYSFPQPPEKYFC